MEGGEEDRRKIGVTSVPYGGDWRRGLCPKFFCCTEPDYLKWKFLRRGSRDLVPFAVDRVRDRQGRGGVQ